MNGLAKYGKSVHQHKEHIENEGSGHNAILVNKLKSK